MALTLYVNSYVTLDEANAYFAYRSNSDGWRLLNNNQKEELLATSTQYLDDVVNYVGVAVSTSQALAWPRIGSYVEPKYNSMVEIVENILPDRVKRATYEMALHLIEHPDVLSTHESVGSIGVSSIKLSDIQKPSRLPHMVRKIISPLSTGLDEPLPWRAW
jgi:hypothetical protein